VTIVEFADFQCPFCAAAVPYLKRLRQNFPSRVTIIYRHYVIHQHAFAAAVAAECARAAGRFERYHDALYGQPSLIGRVSWSTLASRSGVIDTLAFRRCLHDPETARRVAQDTLAASRLGVHGTPTFLMNDVLVEGFPGPTVMDSVFASVLARATSGGRSH
jgi:protein-disulfide isomerase